ncbi:MAG: UbiX family flavin prenyltransferase [Bacteroidales bacterium]|nr:UbiX family flavin prenyltransferase [Bacteroidales bacterium]
MEPKKLIIAATGASGAIYCNILLQKLASLKDQIQEIVAIFSDNAKEVWEYELKNDDYKKINYPIFDQDDFYAPPASGSSGFHTMIVCPCSMGTLGKIASGIADNLITRSADVMLKERRKLILVTREAPFSLIHINNMKTVTEAGGIICPASPSFYSLPSTIEEVCTTIVDRILELAGFKIDTYRWKQK